MGMDDDILKGLVAPGCWPLRRPNLHFLDEDLTIPSFDPADKYGARKFDIELNLKLIDALLDEHVRNGPDIQTRLQGEADFPPDIRAEIERFKIKRDQTVNQLNAVKLDELLDKLQCAPPTDATPMESPAPASAPDSPTISEAEAARLLGYSRRQLGNMRRARQIPRSLYRQNGKGGLVRYYRERFMAWAANREKN